MVIGLKSGALGPLTHRFRTWWVRRSLFDQFAIAASAVLTLSVISGGVWVSAKVGESVLRATSTAAALYVTNFVEPYVQSMSGDGSLALQDIRKLDEVTEQLKAKRHAVSIKIWRRDGVIAYSNQKTLVGRQFSTVAISASLKGKIRAGMADFDDDDSEFEKSLSMPLYEVFLPLYETETNNIIAVAEIYEDARPLLRDQAHAVRSAWLVLGTVGICTLLGLFAIVYRGSLTIERQRSAIKRRFREQMRLHRKNNELQTKMQEALRKSVQVGDLVQTRIGVELHDGPVQLMSHVLLRLDEVERDLNENPSARSLVAELRGDAKSAIKELRAISAGLFLPDINETGDALGVVRSVISAHEDRTNCVVTYSATNVPERLPREAVRCIARVVQEALSNSHKHSGSVEQNVSVRASKGALLISIGDTGKGILPHLPGINPTGLGIPGMASRVEALGGSMLIKSDKGSGTEVTFKVPI